MEVPDSDSESEGRLWGGFARWGEVGERCDGEAGGVWVLRLVVPLTALALALEAVAPASTLAGDKSSARPGPVVFDGEMGEGGVGGCTFGVSMPKLTDSTGSES
jgi:hypothetical protein